MALNAKQENGPFYVYELIDPRNDAVFYVGKGKGLRAWVHEARARRGREPNALKAEVLGQIRRAGLSPIVNIAAENLTEEDAYKIERGMIVRNHAALTNIALGSRSALERVKALARENIANLKPLCVMVREGSDGERLKMWAKIRSGFNHVAVFGQ